MKKLFAALLAATVCIPYYPETKVTKVPKEEDMGE